jgi:hypothetical protein
LYKPFPVAVNFFLFPIRPVYPADIQHITYSTAYLDKKQFKGSVQRKPMRVENGVIRQVRALHHGAGYFLLI